MTRIISVLLFHIAIYMTTELWWANAGLAVIFGFLYHKSIPWWLQVVTVSALVLGESVAINVENQSRLADQLIQVFGLSGGWLLVLLSTIVIGLGVILGQWTGRSIRTNLRPLNER